MADKSGVYGPWSKDISKSAHATEAIECLNEMVKYKKQRKPKVVGQEMGDDLFHNFDVFVGTTKVGIIYSRVSRKPRIQKGQWEQSPKIVLWKFIPEKNVDLKVRGKQFSAKSFRSLKDSLDGILSKAVADGKIEEGLPKNSKKTLEAIEWLNKKYDAMTDDEHTEHFLGEAKKRKKKCKKCTGYGCYYCGYRGYLFAPFYGKGDGTSAAAISTGPGGSSGSGGGPAFPGAGGVNAPGVPGGPNSGMGSSMSYDGNALMADIDAIGRLCERTRTTGSVQSRSEVNLYRELD